ncbi:MAG: NOG1 family protein [Candidatus Methanofastidiosia archaeon]
MFKKIPYISIDEIINKAFSRSAKTVVKSHGPKNLVLRDKEMEKVERSAQIIASSLQKVIDRYPEMSELDDFNWNMIDILAGVRNTRKNLDALRWAITSIFRTDRKILKRMEGTKEKDSIIQYRKEAYGKYNSILRTISKNIDELNEAQIRLKEIPPISTNDYTVVIAGYPNVGKSSILAHLTTSKPMIAPYPFTTRGINIGTFKLKYQRIYVIDTPGLLDRPTSKRNEIEHKATTAIKYLASVLIFVIDGSKTRNYTLDEQYALLEDVKAQLGDMPLIIVQNKIDVDSDDVKADVKISSLESSGIQELKTKLTRTILDDKAFEEKRKLIIKKEEG